MFVRKVSQLRLKAAARRLTGLIVVLSCIVRLNHQCGFYMKISSEDKLKFANENLYKIFEVLNGEFLACFDMVQKNDSQIARRTLVRALFAEIEGVTFCMKQVAFESRSRAGVTFTTPEIILLSEEAYELNDKGEVKSQRAKLHISRNIRFAFRAFARTGYINYEPKVDGIGWDAFKKGLKIRDRLMHPKKPDDLIVSDEEVVIIKTTFEWFRQSMIEVIKLSLAVLEKIKAELEKAEEKKDGI